MAQLVAARAAARGHFDLMFRSVGRRTPWGVWAGGGIEKHENKKQRGARPARRRFSLRLQRNFGHATTSLSRESRSVRRTRCAHTLHDRAARSGALAADPRVLCHAAGAAAPLERREELRRRRRSTHRAPTPWMQISRRTAPLSSERSRRTCWCRPEQVRAARASCKLTQPSVVRRALRELAAAHLSCSLCCSCAQ